MPQVDLETLVSSCAGGGGATTDSKIVCETLAHDAVPDEPPPANDRVSDVAPDVPPESFWLSKDAEYDWFDRNAFYERKDSTKGGGNASSSNFNASASQRSSVGLRSKVSIIGLPKAQNTTYNSKWRTCRAVNSIRLFPKRTASTAGKSTTVVEPGSPKVSCMGRVRSKRSRRRSNSVKRREEKLSEKEKTRSSSSSSGFYSKVMSLFRSKKSGKRNVKGRKMEDEVVEDEVVEVEVEPPRMSVSVAEPPGLGGMMRFASGRRSGSFTAEEVSLPVAMGRR